MAFSKKFLLGSTVIAGVMAMAAAPAWAQTTPPAPGNAQAQAPVTDAENQDDGTEAEEQADQGAQAATGTTVEELVVTGSRIRRSEFSSAAPIQVLTQDSASLEGIASTSDLLQNASVTGGAFQINNQLTGFVVAGGPGVNTIALRGLGAQQTLTLINGRRAGPAGTRGQVGPFDLNVIPSSIIERVEILKDGASSIYGSDAVAGVVNFITRTNLDGAEITAYANAPFEGGAEQFRISGAWGRTFDRGYFNIAGEYYRQEALLVSDRDDTACAADYFFNAQAGVQGSAGSRADLINPRTNSVQCYGLFANVLRLTSGDFFYLRPGETRAQYDPRNGYSTFTGLDTELIRQGRAGFANTRATGNYQDPLYGRRTAVSPVERYTLYSTFGYDLTPNVEFYAEGLVNRRESEQNSVRQFFPQTYSAVTNQLQPSGRPLPASAGATFTPIIPFISDGAQTVDYGRIVAGFRGRLPNSLGFLSNWDYDIYGQYARSEGTYGGNFIYNDRVAALTGISTPNALGQIFITGTAPCYQGPLIPNLSGYSCSQLPGGINFVSPRVLSGAFNAQELAFLQSYEEGNTTYDHMYVEGTMSGDLFRLPAGAVGAAVGFQLRREEIDDTPGAQAQLRNYWGSTTAGPTRGEDTIRELFGEVEIPILRNVRGFQDLTIQLSGRYSDYDSYGSNSTYKIGANWQIVPEIRLRATYGTSFRAPSLFEQFLGNQTGFQGQVNVDPCIRYEDSSNAQIRANCAAAGVPTGYTAGGTSSALVSSGGGRGILTPEESDAQSIGIIFTPTNIDLSVAIDYFEIEVRDEIRQFGAANILFQCYSASDYPTNPYCSLFTRNPFTATSRPGEIVNIQNNYVNVASQRNRGIDLTLRYQRPFSFGNFRVDGQFTWMLQDTINILGGLENDYLGTTYNFRGPDFLGNVQFRLDRGDWTFAWSVDLLGKGSDTESRGGDIATSTAYSNTCRTAAGVTAPCNTLTDATGAVPAGTTVVALPIYQKQFTEFSATHTFSVRRVFDQWTLTAGIRNVFDERAPSVSSNGFRIGTAAIMNSNDYLYGRQGFVSVTRRF